MISRRSGRFYRIGDLIALFVQMGCELRNAEQTVEMPDGDVFNCRYLINPDTADFQPILDLTDDDAISGWELASWERRLKITIPKPE